MESNSRNERGNKMKNCEYCNKKQKELHACLVHDMWVCDKCYSHTLNPYTEKREQMTSKQFENWLWNVEWKTFNKKNKKGETQ